MIVRIHGTFERTIVQAVDDTVDAKSSEGRGYEQRATDQQRGGADDSRPQSQHSPEISRYCYKKKLVHQERRKILSINN